MNKRDRPSNEISLRFAARAFRHRNYRLFFGGQGLSLIGTWMQQIAMSWLVYRLTNSPFMLGFVGFTGQVPTFLLASFAGVLADRWNRRNLLYVTQTVSMLQAFMLAALTLSGSVTVWQIVILSAVLGIVNAFDVPIRQSFVVEIVEKKEELGNAIALNSFMFNGARLVGPSLAGLLIGAVGEGICFLLNGVSFLAIIFALWAMTIPMVKRRQGSVKMLEGLSEGFRYAFQFTPIRYILLLLGLVSLMGMPYLVLLPVFARDILHGGPDTLGFLMAAAGVGAVCGALYLASRKSVLGLGKLIVIASSLFGCALIAFSFSRNLVLSLLLMLFTGFSMIVLTASSNTILQTIVEEDKRGRVMSFFAMSFIGMAPFGSLLAGSLASRIGAPFTLTLSGIVCIAGSLSFFSRLPAIRKMVRPIYVQMGIIREFPSELQ
jgi:MFS family permease